MKITLIRQGPKLSLYGYVKKNKCQVMEFISRINDNDFAQVANVFKLLCEAGTPHNERKFRKIRGIKGEIYEIKTANGFRILCFKSEPDNPDVVKANSILEPSLILIKGFKKPQQKILTREAKKAEDLRQQYFNETIETWEL